MSQDQEIRHDMLTVLSNAGHEYETPRSRMQTYGPHVKITCKPAAPPSCDLVVSVWNYGKWEEVARFNDMSDDNAFTNAHNRAIAERAKILEQEW